MNSEITYTMTSKRPKSEAVKVVCRIRPTNQREISSGGVQCLKYTDSMIEVGGDSDGYNNFTLDRIFGPETTQLELFDQTVAPLISDVLSGYNATIFAYGQTGTGSLQPSDIHRMTLNVLRKNTHNAWRCWGGSGCEGDHSSGR